VLTRPNERKPLLQFRALRLALLQDGDVGIGVFPGGSSVWQANAAQQIGIAGVGAHPVPEHIYP
jgi:hypothetical protein